MKNLQEEISRIIRTDNIMEATQKEYKSNAIIMTDLSFFPQLKVVKTSIWTANTLKPNNWTGPYIVTEIDFGDRRNRTYVVYTDQKRTEEIVNMSHNNPVAAEKQLKEINQDVQSKIQLAVVQTDNAFNAAVKSINSTLI